MKLIELLKRDKAKKVISNGAFTACPTCKMMLKLRMDEETFCPYCGQRLDRKNPETRMSL